MIDPKTLHIGSLVMVDGVRARVIRIDEPKDEHEIPPCTLLRFKALVDGEWRDCGCSADSDKVEPIPITAELLRELGFKMTNEIGDEHHVAWVREKPWDAYIEYNMNAKLFFAHFGPFNVIRVDYLHEAEYAFYLAYKQELIKE